MTDEWPTAPAAARPLWLVTLADLALLLLGFVLLVQATRHDAHGALARGLRDRFGGEAARSDPMPVAAAALGFAPGSATPVAGTGELVAWAREAARDPRVTVLIAGQTDGTPPDRDAATGSAALLALDRARAAAALLAPIVPAERMAIAVSPGRHGRAALVTLGFAGERR